MATSYSASVKALQEVPYYSTHEATSKNKRGKYKKDATFTVSGCKTTTAGSNKVYWVKNKSTGFWSILSDGDKTYLKIVKDNSNPPLFNGKVTQTKYINKKGKTVYLTVTPVNYELETAYSTGGSVTISYCIPSEKTSSLIESSAYKKLPITTDNWNVSKHQPVLLKRSKSKSVLQRNANAYPSATKVDKKYQYDYTISIQNDIRESIQNIKENLNVPSAYSRLELNKKFHSQFNRFRIQYPDYFLNNTIAYVVMTRPDLNLFNSNGEMLKQIANDPQLYYIVRAGKETAKTLTKNYSGAHDFNPLLSNTLTSLDIQDESIDTLETGETFTGFKTQYAKSNIRSMTAGTINLRFPEVYNMSITHAHQLWCSYESGVYRGSLKPKSKYIWGKELDYACDIYYFLLDVEDMIIRYWCKYTGCFPLNVNKSVFSYDVGTQIQHPELSVTYAYFAREDLSPTTLNEFNNNSGGISNGFTYRANYIAEKGGPDSCGKTWSNAPFVQAITRKNGFDLDSELFALRFRPL